MTIYLGDDCAPYYKDNIYALPINEVIFLQIGLSILLGSIGLAWSGLVLTISERLLSCLKFYPLPSNKFRNLSLRLFKLAAMAIFLGIVIANISS